MVKHRLKERKQSDDSSQESRQKQRKMRGKNNKRTGRPRNPLQKQSHEMAYEPVRFIFQLVGIIIHVFKSKEKEKKEKEKGTQMKIENVVQQQTQTEYFNTYNTIFKTEDFQKIELSQKQKQKYADKHSIQYQIYYLINSGPQQNAFRFWEPNQLLCFLLYWFDSQGVLPLDQYLQCRKWQDQDKWKKQLLVERENSEEQLLNLFVQLAIEIAAVEEIEFIDSLHVDLVNEDERIKMTQDFQTHCRLVER